MRGIAFIIALAALGASAGPTVSYPMATNIAEAVVREATNGLIRVEADPTVPAWAKAAQKPDYTAGEVGAYTKAETDEKIVELAPAPGNYSAVSNNAMTAVQPGSLAPVATSGSYDDLDDKPAIPAPTEMVEKQTIEWQANGNAILVNVLSGGTLAATLANWVEGQTVMAVISVASGASIASNLRLVGYTSIPTGQEVMCACTRVGSLVYINPVTTIE